MSPVRIPSPVRAMRIVTRLPYEPSSRQSVIVGVATVGSYQCREITVRAGHYLVLKSRCEDLVAICDRAGYLPLAFVVNGHMRVDCLGDDGTIPELVALIDELWWDE